MKQSKGKTIVTAVILCIILLIGIVCVLWYTSIDKEIKPVSSNHKYNKQKDTSNTNESNIPFDMKVLPELNEDTISSIKSYGVNAGYTSCLIYDYDNDTECSYVIFNDHQLVSFIYTESGDIIPMVGSYIPSLSLTDLSYD